MKTTAYLLALVCISLLSNGQLRKGQWIVGGITDFAHSTTEDTYTGYDRHTRQTSYDFHPGGGYFLIDRLAAGVRADISNSNTKVNANGVNPVFSFEYSAKTTMSGIGGGPFARYYIFKSSTK